MEVLLAIIDSPFVKKYVVTPLAVIGFYQIFRGVTTIIKKDFSEKEWLDGWILSCYLIVTVLGCLCLIVAI